MRKAWICRRIVTPGGEVDGAVLVEDGRIHQICTAEELPPDAELHHVPAGCALLPGLVDTHVHINEPGRTEWEGFATATRAAAAGGFTTLVDMPLNCLPETTTVAALEAKRAAAAGQCRVDWMSWGGVVDGNQAHIAALAQAGVPGFKCFLVSPGCDGFTSIDAANLELALPVVASTGLPLLVHAELQGPMDAALAALPPPADPAWRRYHTYLSSRPDEAELAAVRMLLDLCRRHRFRLHIVHLSTALALPMLQAAKAEGLPLTLETCPHYLHLAAEHIADGATGVKCAPPIRSSSNREALWQGLRDGIIDLIVTDHSPCPPAMKHRENGRFSTAWGGIASLSAALPVVWTEAAGRGFALTDIARWMSTAPATLAGLSSQVGSIDPGTIDSGTIDAKRDANFVVFDPEACFTLTEEHLHHRHKISPYLGQVLRGRVRQTVLRGETVYQDGSFPPALHGREYGSSA